MHERFLTVTIPGLSFDAITVAPYMGEDSVTPFLQYKNKWVILLALTSNKGSKDFQLSENVKYAASERASPRATTIV
jgi:orotidine-5'-phosphate decarboxylase